MLCYKGIVVFVQCVHEISRSRANKATRFLASGIEGPQYDEALSVANAWRSQHIYPTQEVFKILGSIVEPYDNTLVTYRLKRMESIISKLSRSANDFKLGALDDIGGCRIIVPDIKSLYKVSNIIKEKFLLKDGSSVKDYVSSPKSNGYRSIHFLTKQQNCTGGKSSYRVEIQLRTRLQHVWATAVEIADAILGLRLKSPAYERSDYESAMELFFAKVSLLFQSEEDNNLTCTDRDSLIIGVRKLNDEWNLLGALSEAVDSVLSVDSINAVTLEQVMHILKFSTERQEFSVESFKSDNEVELIERYNNLERLSHDSNAEFDDIVLVRANYPNFLKDAYPNYSFSNNEFVTRVSGYLGA